MTNYGHKSKTNIEQYKNPTHTGTVYIAFLIKMATAATEAEINFCVYCPKEAVLQVKGKKYCSSCRKVKRSRKFSISINVTIKEMEQNYFKDMIYCYNCGEELTRDDGKVMCIGGCDLVEIEEG